MLEIKNLSIYTNENKELLYDFNFKFEAGNIYAIMGPNGAGKSTLLNGITGSHNIKLDEKSKVIYDKTDITKLSIEEKARKKIFMAFQTPVSLEGISVLELLKAIVKDQMDIIQLQEKVMGYAKQLHIDTELIHRPLNEKFSGGEKKKMEILQMAILEPEVILLDEFDTGVDIDSLQVMSEFLSKFHNQKRIFIIVTHNARILNWLKPNKVLVIQNGHLHKIGDASLAKEIDQSGFEFPCCKICGNSNNPLECKLSPYNKQKTK